MRTYVKVKAADGYVYYMAQALLDKVLGKLATEDTPAYEVLENLQRNRSGIQRIRTAVQLCSRSC